MISATDSSVVHTSVIIPALKAMAPEQVKVEAKVPEETLEKMAVIPKVQKAAISEKVVTVEKVRPRHLRMTRMRIFLLSRLPESYLGNVRGVCQSVSK